MYFIVVVALVNLFDPSILQILRSCSLEYFSTFQRMRNNFFSSFLQNIGLYLNNFNTYFYLYTVEVLIYIDTNLIINKQLIKELIP